MQTLSLCGFGLRGAYVALLTWPSSHVGLTWRLYGIRINNNKKYVGPICHSKNILWDPQDILPFLVPPYSLFPLSLTLRLFVGNGRWSGDGQQACKGRSVSGGGEHGGEGSGGSSGTALSDGEIEGGSMQPSTLLPPPPPVEALPPRPPPPLAPTPP